MPEVVHVAPGARVLRVERLPLARLGHADELARVLDHELAAAERARRDHAAPFAFEICYLLDKKKFNTCAILLKTKCHSDSEGVQPRQKITRLTLVYLPILANPLYLYYSFM